MLSVVIETENDEEGLARTLGSLIGSAVEGVVRDVIVCDRGSTDQTHRVAEHAGCRFIAQGGLPAAIAQAKGDWLLFLEPGARLVDGWTEDVLRHVSRMDSPARFSPARDHRWPLLSRLFARRGALAGGLVVRKAQAAVLSRNADGAAALAYGLRTKRLAAEIRVADRRPRNTG